MAAVQGTTTDRSRSASRPARVVEDPVPRSPLNSPRKPAEIAVSAASQAVTVCTGDSPPSLSPGCASQ